jgi:septal ring factor EnvC (AmiA/AmiB activator)
VCNKNIFYYIGAVIVLLAAVFMFGRCTADDRPADYQQVKSDLDAANSTIIELERTAKETGNRIRELEQIEKRFTELQQRFSDTNSELDRIYRDLKNANSGITELYTGIAIGNREALELIEELEKRYVKN